MDNQIRLDGQLEQVCKPAAQLSQVMRNWIQQGSLSSSAKTKPSSKVQPWHLLCQQRAMQHSVPCCKMAQLAQPALRAVAKHCKNQTTSIQLRLTSRKGQFPFCNIHPVRKTCLHVLLGLFFFTAFLVRSYCHDSMPSRAVVPCPCRQSSRSSLAMLSGLGLGAFVSSTKASVFLSAKAGTQLQYR